VPRPPCVRAAPPHHRCTRRRLRSTPTMARRRVRMLALLPLWRAARTTGKQSRLAASGDYPPRASHFHGGQRSRSRRPSPPTSVALRAPRVGFAGEDFQDLFGAKEKITPSWNIIVITREGTSKIDVQTWLVPATPGGNIQANSGWQISESLCLA
jgi:hypothetical protein